MTERADDPQCKSNANALGLIEKNRAEGHGFGRPSSRGPWVPCLLVLGRSIHPEIWQEIG
ncbi:hypothetical protein SAMN05444166_6341 [Singulisphaera sp. GP187]|nr:hypothetical protein SAMN05444166_6341 [Singulisphaera sp. GP187]